MNMYYCAEKMINKFDKLSKKPIHKLDDLSVETVPHGIICPLVRGSSGQNERCMYGGVVDEAFKFVKSSLQKRENCEFSINIEDWYIGAEPDISGKNIKYIDEDVVFIYSKMGDRTSCLGKRKFNEWLA